MTTSTNTSQRQDKSAGPAIAPSGSQVRGTGNSAANPATAQVTDERRRQMIAVVAYYRAERRGFCEGGELDDWLAAEAEVGRQLQDRTDS
jgi:hypothetical protein